MSNFKYDLINAQSVENEIKVKFMSSGYTATTTADFGLFSGYDLQVDKADVTYYLEAKHDIMAEQTGNVAIELYKVLDGVKYKSGLSATSATHYIYKIKDSFYSITVGKLKKMLKELEYKNILPIVAGGDNNSVRLALISVERFKRACILI